MTEQHPNWSAGKPVEVSTAASYRFQMPTGPEHTAGSMRPTEAEMAAAIVEWDAAVQAREGSRMISLNEAFRPVDYAPRDAAVREAKKRLHELAARLPRPGPFAAQERNGEVR